MTNKEKKNIKHLTGIVVSDKQDKTISVSVAVPVLHPVYKKRYIDHRKFYAHDEGNIAKEGQTVTIRMCKPRSKKKRRELVE